MIKAYLEGKLDQEDMHRLEKQALNDPFLWEALEGYAHTSNPGPELSLLQRQLHERIVHLQENKKVFDFTWQRLSVAASASVLFITAGILFWMNIHRSVPVSEKQVEVALIDRDSINTEIHGLANGPVIREKEYPVSSNQTSIAAVPLPGEANKETSPAAELSSAEASIQSAKLRMKESASDGSALASSSAVNASEQVLQPLTGWDIYRKYLEDNLRKPAIDRDVNGSVLLFFEIDDKGKPSSFRIIKGLTEACNAEAIRLIKDGPLWKAPAGSNIRSGRIEVRF